MANCLVCTVLVLLCINIAGLDARKRKCDDECKIHNLVNTVENNWSLATADKLLEQYRDDVQVYIDDVLRTESKRFLNVLLVYYNRADFTVRQIKRICRRTYMVVADIMLFNKAGNPVLLNNATGMAIVKKDDTKRMQVTEFFITSVNKNQTALDPVVLP